MIELIEYLFGVVFVKLRLAAISSPKAEDFRFGTVGHVDAVVTNFQESQITGSISSHLTVKLLIIIIH
jgi:hypothetical protein